MTRRLAIALLLACCRATTASAADCASLQLADRVPGDCKAPADAFAVELQLLHPDVYLVRRPEPLREPVEPNTVFVVNDDDVVVFDAGGMPIVAERTIALIRTVTDKPVSVLVNSHWHGDHVLGNQVYRAEYPGLRIVAHPETYAAMTGAPMAYVERYGPMLDDLIEAWTAQQESGELTPARAGLLPDIVLMRDEIARVSIVPPDVLVDDLLVLERGRREIHIRHFGRGNTPGDLVMWLPAEGILATGDLVVHPLPYGFGSFPRDWIDTLEALAGLEFELLVPGHGEPQRDTVYLRRIQALLHEVRRQVGAAVADGLDLESTRARLELRAFIDEFAGDDPDRRRKFEQWWISPISRSAWLEARGEPIVQGAADETG